MFCNRKKRTSLAVVIFILLYGLIISGCQSAKVVQEDKSKQDKTAEQTQVTEDNNELQSENRQNDYQTNTSRASEIEKELIESAKTIILENNDFKGAKIKDIKIITSDQLRSYSNDNFPKRDYLIALQTDIDDRRNGTGRYGGAGRNSEFSEAYIFLITFAEPVEGLTAKKNNYKALVILNRQYSYQDFTLAYEAFEDGYGNWLVR